MHNWQWASEERTGALGVDTEVTELKIKTFSGNLNRDVEEPITSDVFGTMIVRGNLR